MFVVLLRFTNNRSQAGQFMDGHNAWLQRGFDDGVFLLAGSLQPGQGGAIVAVGSELAELQRRLNEDPFVSHGVVSAEILEIEPGKTDPRLSFLLDTSVIRDS